jgi:hypothetical protein
MNANLACHNVFEFAAAIFDIPRDNTASQRSVVDRASHRLFKHSPAGLGLSSLGRDGNYLRGPDGNEPVWGVTVTGIVEGTDIEGSRKLMFPFDGEDFWRACENLTEELDDAQGDEP